RLVFEGVLHIVMQQCDGFGVAAATVDDGGYFVGQTTQAAARTFPLIVTGLGIEGEIDHGRSPWVFPSASATRTFDRVDVVPRPLWTSGGLSGAVQMNIALMDSSLLTRRTA